MWEAFGKKISKIDNLIARCHAGVWQSSVICSSEQLRAIYVSAALVSGPAKPLRPELLTLAPASDSDSANSPLSDRGGRAPRHTVSMSFHRRLTPPRCRHSGRLSGPPG